MMLISELLSSKIWGRGGPDKLKKQLQMQRYQQEHKPTRRQNTDKQLGWNDSTETCNKQRWI